VPARGATAQLPSTALVVDLPLLTKDDRLRKNPLLQTIW
jgi:hypothetical protein